MTSLTLCLSMCLCVFYSVPLLLCAQTARRGMCSHRGLAAGALSVALGTRAVARGRRPVCTLPLYALHAPVRLLSLSLLFTCSTVHLFNCSFVHLSSRVFQCSEHARVRCIERRRVPLRCHRAHYSPAPRRRSRSYYLIPDTLMSVSS